MRSSVSGAECQCPSCGVVFGGLSNFDAHQTWTGRGDAARLTCKTPEIMGLHVRVRRGGVEVWVSPNERFPEVNDAA